jgi:predicted TPR repeat methyltransferase
LQLLRPDWLPQGWSRKAFAHFMMGQYSDAADAYQQGLDIDPDSAVLRSGLREAEAKLGQQLREAKASTRAQGE